MPGPTRRVFGVALVASLAACATGRVAPPEHDRDFITSPVSHKDIPAQGAAHVVQRLSQDGAGPLVLQVRPEDPEEGVAAMQIVRSLEDEVGEEGETLGLGEDGADGHACRVAEVDRPQRPKLDHPALHRGSGLPFHAGRRTGNAPRLPSIGSRAA